MSMNSTLRGIAAGALLVCGFAAQASADVKTATTSSTYYTSYTVAPGATTIGWSSCGATACYGSGQLGPFGHQCAVTGSDDMIYVADSASLVNGAATGDAVIYVYRQISSAKPSVTLVGTVTLPVAAAAQAQCSMAILGNYLWFGTNQNNAFYRVNLSNYAVYAETQYGIVCNAPTTSIYASDKYVIVNQQGNCATQFGSNGSWTGTSLEAGTAFFPGTNGFIPPQ